MRAVAHHARPHGAQRRRHAPKPCGCSASRWRPSRSTRPARTPISPRRCSRPAARTRPGSRCSRRCEIAPTYTRAQDLLLKLIGGQPIVRLPAVVSPPRPRGGASCGRRCLCRVRAGAGGRRADAGAVERQQVRRPASGPSSASGTTRGPTKARGRPRWLTGTSRGRSMRPPPSRTCRAGSRRSPSIDVGEPIVLTLEDESSGNIRGSTSSSRATWC